MDTSFGASDVLRIAAEVERKAARFYLQAARRFDDVGRRSVCYDLASWRVRHQQAWDRLRREYSEKTGQFGRFDPDDYVSSNPQVMAGLTWIGLDWDLRRRLFGQQSEQQILHDAVKRAGAIIIFYRGLKDFACDAPGRRMIDAMIDEEARHIRLLTRSLDSRSHRPPGRGLDAGPTHLSPLCAAV